MAQVNSTNLKKLLIQSGIDVTTFEKLALDFDDDVEVQAAENGDGEKHGDQFYIFDVKSESAMQTWDTLRALVDTTGYWPIITDSCDDLVEFMEINEISAAEAIEASETIDIEPLLVVEADDGSCEEGTWPDAKPAQNETDCEFNIISSTSGDLTIVLCPTAVAWQVAAVLRWGNSNDGIEPEAHAAIHRKWHTEYGAEPVCANISTIEMKVTRPPTSKDGAMKLAREQYAYCPDIVEQGTKTIANLGAQLLDSPKWYFWWD